MLADLQMQATHPKITEVRLPTYIQPPLLTICVTLGKLPNFSKQLILENEDNEIIIIIPIITIIGGYFEILVKLIHLRHLEYLKLTAN